MAQVHSLAERDEELQTVRDLLGRVGAGGAGGVVVIEGPAGIGKSSLLAVALDQAGDLGETVGRARASELEQEFPFGVVRQLFEPVLARGHCPQSELFAGAAALARPLVQAGERYSETIEPHAALHGLYWMTANLATDAPVLLVVDDLHWADPPSARFLAYLANRIDDLPIAVIVATRPVDAGDRVVVFDELVANASTRLIQPAPLGLEGVTTSVVAELGVAHPVFAATCRDATSGNPLLLRELLVRLRRDGVEPDEANAERVLEIAPDSLARSVTRWIRQLPEPAGEVARALAVLGDRADLATAAHLAGVAVPDAANATAALRHADLLDAEGLRYRHPLVRSAVYEQIGPGDRADLHRRAAAQLATTRADDEEVTAHLLHAQPAGDRWVVETLRRMAARASTRGAPDMAARYLSRALTEPPAPETLGMVLVELGKTEIADGRIEGLDHIRAARDAATDPVHRAALGLELGRGHSVWWNLAESARVLETALADLGDADPVLRTRIEATLCSVCVPDPALRPPEFEQLLDHLRDRAETVTDPLMLTVLGVAAGARHPPAADSAILLQRALESGALSYVDEPLGIALAAMGLIHVDRFEPAEALLTAVMSDPRSGGAPAPMGFALTLRSLVLLRVGDIARAESYADDALARLHRRAGGTDQVRLLNVVPFMLLAMVEAALERGELERADASLEQYGLSGELPDIFGFNNLLDARGRLRVAQHRLQEGIADLRECGRRMDADALISPGVIPWRTSLAAALATAGETAEARKVIETEIAHAERFELPRELGMALRVAGLLDPDERGLQLLQEAVAALDRSAAHLEHAHALVDLGARLRRVGRRTDARTPLRTGLDLAAACGATALAERAHAELAASGARPRRLAVSGLDALTPSERRVADLAAEGLTNRLIAQTLFVTEKTVEGHLGHVYAKLGVTSRSQLPGVLGDATALLAS